MLRVGARRRRVGLWLGRRVAAGLRRVGRRPLLRAAAELRARARHARRARARARDRHRAARAASRTTTDATLEYEIYSQIRTISICCSNKILISITIIIYNTP